jgi:cephalosporin hydroxylase
VILRIDLNASTVEVEYENGIRRFPLASPEAFSLVSKAWLRAGWDAKYVYRFTWLGRPVIQLPEDLVRIQEVIYRVRPSVIVETGVAHGGSLVFYASLCKMLDSGRVVGVDIEIRPHNRKALEEHPLAGLITLYEGDSRDPAIVDSIRGSLEPDDTVLVVLDSNHAKDHVLRELELYAPLVSVGSYVIAADGIMADIVGAPRTKPDWEWNNPRAAAEEFVSSNAEFVLDEPSSPFNEGAVQEPVTYWGGGWIRRVA